MASCGCSHNVRCFTHAHEHAMAKMAERGFQPTEELKPEERRQLHKIGVRLLEWYHPDFDRASGGRTREERNSFWGPALYVWIATCPLDWENRKRLLCLVQKHQNEIQPFRELLEASFRLGGRDAVNAALVDLAERSAIEALKYMTR